MTTLFGALAFADVSTELQSLARLITPEYTRSLSCYSANHLADLFRDVGTLAGLGAQFLKGRLSNTAREWDRILFGLIETFRTEIRVACADSHVDPRLCEEIAGIQELYVRKRVCAEISDLEWRRTRCPVEPDIDSNVQAAKLSFRFRNPLLQEDWAEGWHRLRTDSNQPGGYIPSGRTATADAAAQIATIPGLKEFKDASFFSDQPPRQRI